MDEVSLIESIRIRMRLRRQGLQPSAKSKCTLTHADLIRMNKAVVTGERGLGVCSDIMALLRADPEGPEWNGALEMNYAESAPLLLACLCDTWRRLHLVYAGLPWQLFRMVDMETPRAVDFLQELRRTAGECPCCGDKLFFGVARRHYLAHQVCRLHGASKVHL